MRNYFKTALRQGVFFGGFGPLITGIIYASVATAHPGLTFSGGQICLAIFSTYLLAFVQAAAGIFHQIESWSPMRSLICHFSVTYLSYILCYLVNSWIPFRPGVMLIFTVCFVAAYLAVWLITWLSIRAYHRSLNQILAKTE